VVAKRQQSFNGLLQFVCNNSELCGSQLVLDFIKHGNPAGDNVDRGNALAIGGVNPNEPAPSAPTLDRQPSARALQTPEILREFHSSTGGSSWGNDENWCSPVSFDQWFGLQVFGTRVTHINLSGNRLHGNYSLPTDATVFLVCDFRQDTCVPIRIDWTSGTGPLQERVVREDPC